jgi:class 3 adenylate cyclase/pimeloyl-ACP methyl ester carboxylesterase
VVGSDTLPGVEAPEVHYVAVGDAELAYQVLGDGPIDLIYHHGFCHRDLMWDIEPEAAFHRRLASFSRLILFDRRGSGASSRLPLGYFPSWEDWNEDLLAILDAVGSKRAAMFVEGEAGPLGILFTAAHPERISGLVLGCTTARYMADDDYPGATQEVIDAYAQAIEQEWGSRELVAFAFPSMVEDPAAFAAQTRILRSCATPRSAALQHRHVWERLDAREALPFVKVPTLVLNNERLDDGFYREEQATALVEGIEGARFVHLSGHGHFLYPEDNGPVTDLVGEFLTGHRPVVAPERFLTTVVFTDIVASTEKLVELGDGEWRQLLDAHDRCVRSALDRFKGQEIKTTGDGFLACFDGPGRAVRCSNDIVEESRRMGLHVRVGMHTGECERRGDDIAGIAVHLAARVGACAGPDEVFVSRTVTDLVAGSGIEFDDRGEYPLRGIDGTARLFSLRAFHDLETASAWG